MDHNYLKEDGKYYPADDDAFMTQIPAEFWDDENKFIQLVDYFIAHPEYANQYDISLGVVSKSSKYCTDKDCQYIKEKLENHEEKTNDY
jgi:hypothetical protein